MTVAVFRPTLCVDVRELLEIEGKLRKTTAPLLGTVVVDEIPTG